MFIKYSYIQTVIASPNYQELFKGISSNPINKKNKPMKLNYTFKLKTFQVIIALVSIVLLFSCNKDKYDFDKIKVGSISPDMAIPISNSTFTIKQFLKSGSENIIEDPSKLLYFVYDQDIISKNVSEMIEIPDQQYLKTITFSIPVKKTKTDSIVKSFQYDLNLATDNEEILDSMVLKGGTLSFDLNSNLNNDAKIVLQIPELVKNGTIFTEVIELKYLGSLPVFASKSFNIAGYTIIPTHVGDTNRLTLNMVLTGYLLNIPNPSPFTIPIQISFSNLEFSKIFGYLGQQTFNIDKASIDLSIFDEKNLVKVNLEDPKIKLHFFNSIGMPISVGIDSFIMENKTQKLNIVGPGLTNIDLNYPFMTQIGQGKNTDHSIDKSNSNFKDGVNMSPSKLGLKAIASMNPTGNKAIKNFALDTSKVRLNAQIEIPIYGRIWDLNIRDTAKFDLNDLVGGSDNLKSVEFRMSTSNGLPLGAKLQVYFTDSNYVIMDSLFAQGDIIKAGIPGPPPAYKITQKTLKNTNVVVDNTKLQKIKSAKNSIIVIQIATTNDGNDIVKFYSDDAIQIRFGARAKYQFDF